MRFFFRRNHQQNIKVLWKRTGESKRIYEMKCREEVASNQFYHQEVARCGKSSKEAEKVRDFEFLNWGSRGISSSSETDVMNAIFLSSPFDRLILNMPSRSKL